MFLKRIYIISLALVLLLSGTGWTEAPTTSDECAAYHVVSDGESLAQIAAKYGTSQDRLLSLNRLPVWWFLFRGQKLCVSEDRAQQTGPIIDIKQTVRDTSVTIAGWRFPAGKTYDVLIGTYGVKGDGISVGTVKADGRGAFRATFNIPAARKGQAKLVIRVQGKVRGYDLQKSAWFYNMTSGPKGYSRHPNIVVNSVVRNKSVNVTIYNLPPGLKFDVRMGVLWNQRGKVVKVTTLDTGIGGTLTTTFTIPSGLAGARTIALGMINAAECSYDYKIFTNK